MGPVALPVHQAWRPAPAPGPLHAYRMGDRAAHMAMRIPVNPNLTEMGQARAYAVGALTIPTIIAAASSYVGFRLGSLDHGIPSVLGYAVGTLGALGALIGVLGIIGVSSLPEILIPQASTNEGYIGPSQV